MSLAVGCAFTPASAAVVPEMAFSFTGVCSDCDGTAHAELVLKDYTLGETMGDANLVSFTYDGTNLLSGFTITPTSPGLYLFGVIDGPFPAPNIDRLRTFRLFYPEQRGVERFHGRECAGRDLDAGDAGEAERKKSS